jgi:hypothetical protein
LMCCAVLAVCTACAARSRCAVLYPGHAVSGLRDTAIVHVCAGAYVHVCCACVSLGAQQCTCVNNQLPNLPTDVFMQHPKAVVLTACTAHTLLSILALFRYCACSNVHQMKSFVSTFVSTSCR